MKKMFLILSFILAFAVNEAKADAPAHCTDWDENYRYCYQCESGYVISYDWDKCVTCSVANCEECSADNVCAYCESGYGKDGNGGCQACPANCSSCQNDANTCSSCKSAYGKDDNGGCRACADSYCSTSYGCQNDYRICTSCRSGYTEQPNGTCAPNPQIENCTGFDNGKCTKCASGYSLLDGEKCVTGCPEGKVVRNEQYRGNVCVSANCKSGSRYSGYSSSESAGYSCYECKSGYVHFGDDCVPSCPEGYVVQAGGTYKNVCKPANCPNITHTSCEKCANGYYLTSDRNCVAECGEGFITGNGKCIPESMGCGNMLNVGGECISSDDCGSGFDLVDGTCVLKTRYTMPEADALTSNDNENMIEWVFQ